MASKRIQEIVDRFVAELSAAAEEDAAMALQDRLRGVLGVSVGDAGSPRKAAVFKRRRTTKGYTVLRPCPIAGCKETAAPRFGMVCKGHGASLSREDILMARDVAAKPGGIWFGLKAGRKVS